MKKHSYNRYLNEHEVSDLTGIKVGTLRNWRSKGFGPRYLKIRHLVRYSLTDVQDFMESHKIRTFDSK